jgi:uncharacterized protein (TIGR00304 family)
MGAVLCGFLVLAGRAPRLEEAGPPAPEPASARQGKAAGFVLLGPIPIAFGTTRGLAVAMLLLALAALALLLLVARLGGP